MSKIRLHVCDRAHAPHGASFKVGEEPKFQAQSESHQGTFQDKEFSLQLSAKVSRKASYPSVRVRKHRFLH